MFSYLCVALVFVAACTAQVQVSTDKPDPQHAMCNKKRNAYHKMNDSCYSYIECIEFIPVERSCPDDLHFNPEAQWPSFPCGHPMDVPCAHGPARTAQVQVSTDKPDPQHAMCNKNRNAYHKMNDSCYSYIECIEFIPVERSCPDDLHFNPEAQWPSFPCGHPMDVPCAHGPARTAQVQVSTDKPDPRHAMCNKNRNAYHKMDGGCHSYIECTEFIPVERSCPDGLHFNPEAQWPSSPCGHPMDVPCAHRPVQPAQPKADCPYQHDNCASPVATPDCGHNRMCENGKAIEMSCPTGQAFNPDTGRCDWHKQVATYNADQFPGISCPAAPTDVSDIIVSYKYQGNCYHFSCVKGHARLLSSDEANARLLSCDEGHARLPSCDEGFAFDSAAGRCVYVGYVSCDGCVQWG